MSKFSAVVLGAIAAAALAPITSAGAHKSPSGQHKQHAHHGQRAAGHLKHAFVIMLENHSTDGVIGDPNAPAITALASRYGLAQNYYGVTHPSEPNYIALLGGDNFGVNNDSPANRFDARNLVDQLEASGHTWAGYMESAPSAGYLGDYWPSSSNALYASKHNPFALFNDVRSNPSRMAHVKPFASLAGDLNGKEKRIPDFALIVPNQCHDMHGGVYTQVAPDGSDGSPCPYGSGNDDANDAALKQKADAFVQSTVRTIIHSKAWRGNSAIFVVADES